MESEWPAGTSWILEYKFWDFTCVLTQMSDNEPITRKKLIEVVNSINARLDSIVGARHESASNLQETQHALRESTRALEKSTQALRESTQALRESTRALAQKNLYVKLFRGTAFFISKYTMKNLEQCLQTKLHLGSSGFSSLQRRGFARCLRKC